MKYSLSKKERRNLFRIIIALTAFLTSLIVDKTVGMSLGGKWGWLLPFFVYLAIYLTISYDVLLKAAKNILHGQVFDENFLMCVASLGAFALAIYRGASGLDTEGFDEACAVLLLYQIGEFFQRYATGRSRKSIAALMDIRPDSATVIRGGEQAVVSPDEVEIGEIIVVQPGERVPLDGIALGDTSLDLRALNGESLPKDVVEGDSVISGSVNLTKELRIKVTRKYGDSTVAKILELVENAADKKSKAENFVSRFASVYTPTVVIAALILAIVPSAVTGAWSTWIYRALSFLVVSCPCALVISIPLSFFSGLGAASRHNILIKGSNYLEAIGRADVFVFDKTGTLTNGVFEVTDVQPAEQREEIMRLAATAECGSSHPIAQSIISAYGGSVDSGYRLENEAGKGVRATKDDTEILCGSRKLMEAHGIACEEVGGTVVYVAKNGALVGHIVIADAIKEESAEVVRELDGMGASSVMLTGDSEEVAASVANELHLAAYRASLLPADKVSELEKLLSQKRKKGGVCFVGDGINDAPVLMRADVGIAMGGVGSDAAIEASDIVLMKDDLRGIPLAKRIAKRTMLVVYENIIFSIAVKVAILILSAFGLTSMWVSVFGDVGVAMIAIVNAIVGTSTLLRINRGKSKPASRVEK